MFEGVSAVELLTDIWNTPEVKVIFSGNAEYRVQGPQKIQYWSKTTNNIDWAAVSDKFYPSLGPHCVGFLDESA